MPIPPPSELRPSPASPISTTSIVEPPGHRSHWLDHAKEPYFLFPIFGALLLLAIWVATLHLIKIEHSAAEHAAAAASAEMGKTYEAQILRALREIDQTLKLVKYTYEIQGQRSALPMLKDRDLLPPGILFVISIANTSGAIVASTNPRESANIADRNDLQTLQSKDTLVVSRPWKSQTTGEWKLRFSRRLGAAEGAFAGIVMVAIDASYFVSDYESSKLGDHGVLGLVGTDGVFRVRRTGETVDAGDAVAYAALVPAPGLNDEAAAVLSVNSWDGVRRYTSARELYDFPLAVIVGLSADERLAVVNRQAQTYIWRATSATFLLVLLVGLLSRMSWQLAQSRLRAAEAKMAYAERIEYLAYHDGLTSLPNRSLFSKLLAHSIGQARRHNRHLSVLFLDIDHFKQINDNLGHEAGDLLLQEIARRLQACLRDSDTVARLGGDEFVVLLPELDEEKYVETVARKILSSVAAPIELGGQELHVTASIGISTYPQNGQDEQTLNKNADIAMYQVKQQGRNNFQFYSEQLSTGSFERLTLEDNLRHALEHKEFQLHYQAKRNIANGLITGMEALLRWHRPGVGMMAPMQFIPVAEEMGLMIPIGKWVLKTACQQNVAWRQQGLPHLTMAVNLTTRQFFDENLLPDLIEILAATGMAPHLLELEISERLLMHDVKKTLSVLTELKRTGVRIAIDDFGTGYSALSALKQFPLDAIKIDRSLIRDATSTAADKALTQAIIAMGRTLSLTLVAQGVETKEQADFFRDHACDELQGFYFNKPVPADQFAKLLQAQSAAAQVDVQRSAND